MNRSLSLLFVCLILSSCISFNFSDSYLSPKTMTIDELIKSGPENIVMTESEKQVYDLLMDYRKQNKLPSIPYSKSLSFVAKLHTIDQNTHTFPSQYNAHSWSKDGPWKSVNYSPDHKYAQLMWDKPRELTKYKGNGYEIAFFESDGVSPSSCVNGWKHSKFHNAVIINADDWKKIKWKSIGISVYKNYADVWFGEEIDPLTLIK